MSDLLEDPDGAPYPQEVQEFLELLKMGDTGHSPFVRQRLVVALESVAESAWTRSAEETFEWTEAATHGSNGPPDPPRNPHEAHLQLMRGEDMT